MPRSENGYSGRRPSPCMLTGNSHREISVCLPSAITANRDTRDCPRPNILLISLSVIRRGRARGRKRTGVVAQQGGDAEGESDVLDQQGNRWAVSNASSRSALASRSSSASETLISRPCSSHVYQVIPMPASCAASSRRRPGASRRRPGAIPTSAGVRRARRDRRNSDSALRASVRLSITFVSAFALFRLRSTN